MAPVLIEREHLNGDVPRCGILFEVIQNSPSQHVGQEHIERDGGWMELASEFQGKVKIGKMDVDSNQATPMRYKVTGIPTLLVFKGGQVVEQLVGYKPKDAISQVLKLAAGGQ